MLRFPRIIKESKETKERLDKVVGVVCKDKDCGVFVSIRGLSKEHDVLFIDQDAVIFLGRCMICDSKEGFEKISHGHYHSRYLENEEACNFCDESR